MYSLMVQAEAVRHYAYEAEVLHHEDGAPAHRVLLLSWKNTFWMAVSDAIRFDCQYMPLGGGIRKKTQSRRWKAQKWPGSSANLWPALASL